MLGFIDVQLYNFINRNMVSPFLDTIMPVITNFGSGHVIFAAAIFILIVAKKEKRLAGIYILAGLTLSYYIVDVVLKDFIAMPRPFLSIPDARVLGEMPRSFSTPSGHSTNTFMLATILYRTFSKNIFWFVLAILVAISRVYIGVHYVSDTLLGAIIGIGIGYFLTRKI